MPEIPIALQSCTKSESWIALADEVCFYFNMSEITQVRQSASHLSATDRAELAAFLLDTLDEAHYWVDDEEVRKRSEELKSGQVRGLTLSEFREACGR